MKNLFLIINVFIAFIVIHAQKTHPFQIKFDDAIPVLNVGTFHMGYTPDANKLEFDEHNTENIRQIHELAKKLAAFRPTIILVEKEPYMNKKLASAYNEYLNNPKIKYDHPSEIELLAYEVGRLSGTKKIYGIDYQEDYYYLIYSALKNPLDRTTYEKFNKSFSQMILSQNNMNIKELFWLNNQQDYLDSLLSFNADILTTVSVDDYPLGAEQAAKFYHRNLVIFSNMNNININKDDRIFILMGAAHTAFLKDFLRRSPKYKEVNALDYIK